MPSKHVAHLGDTGGTFTDCYAITPAGEELRVKVLSTGCIRSRVLEIKDAHTWIIADAWSMPANFFAGFQLRLGEWSRCHHFVTEH